MRDFMKWAYSHEAPDYVSCLAWFTMAVAFMVWLLIIVAFLANCYYWFALLAFVTPSAFGIFSASVEYKEHLAKKERSERHRKI